MAGLETVIRLVGAQFGVLDKGARPLDFSLVVGIQIAPDAVVAGVVGGRTNLAAIPLDVDFGVLGFVGLGGQLEVIQVNRAAIAGPAHVEGGGGRHRRGGAHAPLGLFLVVDVQRGNVLVEAAVRLGARTEGQHNVVPGVGQQHRLGGGARDPAERPCAEAEAQPPAHVEQRGVGVGPTAVFAQDALDVRRHPAEGRAVGGLLLRDFHFDFMNTALLDGEVGAGAGDPGNF